MLSKLAYTKNNKDNLSQYISTNENDLRRAIEIDTGIFTEKNISTDKNIYAPLFI